MEALTNSNAALAGSDAALTEMEEVHLQQLAGLIEQGQDGDFGEFAAVVTEKLLHWPPAHNFAAFDLLRVMLMSPAFAARAVKTRLLEKVLTAGWKAGSDWRCRFNALKSVCNLMPALGAASSTLLGAIDSILGAVDVTFAAAGPVRDHEMVAAAQVALNIAVGLAALPDANLRVRNTKNKKFEIFSSKLC